MTAPISNLTDNLKKIVVGVNTPEKGIIFNDFKNNKAIGEGTSARGLNTQAGNKAFKIISITEVLSEGSPISTSSLSCVGHDTTVQSGDILELKNIRNRSVSIELGFNMLTLSIDVSLNSQEEAITYANNLGFFIGNKYKIVFTDNYVGETISSTTLNSVTPVYDTNEYDITVNGSVRDLEIPYTVGDIAQILCETDVNNSYKIHTISEDGSVIRIVNVDDRIVQAPKFHPTDPENKRNWFYVAGKDGNELCPALVAPIVSGIDSIATGYGATAMGVNTLASGYYATAFGTETKAAYAGTAGGAGSEAGNYGVAIGNYVSALGDGSVATGTSTYARAASSRAGGRGSVANFEYSVAEGLGVVTSQQAQAIFGKYNYVNSDNLFAIGNGKDDTNRSNAFEVRDDGTVWVLNGTERLATVSDVNTKPGMQGPNNSTLLSIHESYTTATGNYSLASGYSKATEAYSIALGWGTSSAQYSFSTGYDTSSSGFASAAFGFKTQAIDHSQFVVGRYNNTVANALFIVGNGDINTQAPSNAFVVHSNGDTQIAGGLILTDSENVKYKVYIENKELKVEQLP